MLKYIFLISLSFASVAEAELPSLACDRGGNCGACDENDNCIRYTDHSFDFRNGCNMKVDPKAPFLKCDAGVCTICDDKKCLSLDFRTKSQVAANSYFQQECSKIGTYAITADRKNQTCTVPYNGSERHDSVLSVACEKDLRVNLTAWGDLKKVEFGCSVQDERPPESSDSRVSSCKP